MNANERYRLLRNPIKNIRRDNSPPPETTDLSFEDGEELVPHKRVKASTATSAKDQQRPTSVQINTTAFLAAEQPNLASTFIEMEEPNPLFAGLDKGISKYKTSKTSTTERRERKVLTETEEFEIVTEDSFSVQARGTFG